MLNNRLVVYAASILMLVAQQATGSLFGNSNGKNIIDTETLNGDTLVKLCSDPSQRISKVSTVAWLLQQFESSSDQSLAKCKDQYLEPLKALNAVTSQYEDDVCSLNKANLIDQFHWDYQMGAMSKKWTKFSRGHLPEPLKVFFLHYASELAATCKANLPESIDSAVEQKDSSQDEASTLDGDFGRIVSQFQKVLVPFDNIKHYDNFVLLWDMMINHERKKRNEIQFKDPKSGETLVALIKVKDASKVWAAQQRCRQILRPVYRNTILPVMKLIDMGYDSRDKQLDDEFKANGEHKDWHMLTQTCELLLPMKFYEDKSMKFWEMGTMDSWDEADKYVDDSLSADERRVELSQVKQVRLISLPDELQSAINSDESKLLKSVKSNVMNRGSLYRKMVSNVMRNTMSKNFGGYKQIVSMVKKLKLTGNSKHQADDEEIAAEAMKETGEFLEEHEKFDEDNSQDKANGLIRSKRGAGNTDWKFGHKHDGYASNSNYMSGYEPTKDMSNENGIEPPKRKLPKCKGCGWIALIIFIITVLLLGAILGAQALNG